MNHYDCCQPFHVSIICDFCKNECVELRFLQKIVEAVAIFATSFLSVNPSFVQ